MFNFTKDSARAGVSSNASTALNASLPRWGGLFDTGHYLLIWAAAAAE